MAHAGVIAGIVLLLSMGGCLDTFRETTGIDPPDPIRHEDVLLKPGYERIDVEIDYVAGREPSPTAINALRTTLSDVTGKTVDISTTEIPAQGGQYRGEDVYAIHLETFDRAGPGHAYQGAATLHILYLDGKSKPDDQGAEFQGVYYTVTEGSDEDAVIALLPDYWNGLPDSPLEGIVGDTDFEGRYERAVLIHEVGHALGLVGEIPEVRKHEDPDNLGHSVNAGSVMHSGEVPLTEDALIALRERGYDPVWQFDEDDLADLAAYR